MAVAAEFALLERRPIDDDFNLSQELADGYRFVDHMPQRPDLAAERAQVREESEQLLEARRQGLTAGAELLPVDALSTAEYVLQAEQEYGVGSDQYEERWQGLVLDCGRLVGEWYRKLSSEYFAPTRHRYDATLQDFFSHGFSVRQMTENALVPIENRPEEESRRINERVEDATPLIVRKTLGLAALKGVAVRTISECPDEVIARYDEDKVAGRQGSYGGYVPQTHKLMLRDMTFDLETGDRLEEQVAIPGTYVTHEILQEALRRKRLRAEHLDKTALHGAQILANDSLMEFAALLDTVASEEWCVNIFMGEEAPEGFERNKEAYDNFKHEALRRQEMLKDLTLTVTAFVLDLARDGVDKRRALGMVEYFVKSLLLDLGKDLLQGPDEAQGAEIVAHMFDENTVEGLREVVRLEEAGLYDDAFVQMQEVEKAAPGDGYCGAGSCGIEAVNVRSEAGKTLVEKLHAKPGDKIVRDTVRTCPGCGSTRVVYAYNPKKATRKPSKICEGCGLSEINK